MTTYKIKLGNFSHDGDRMLYGIISGLGMGSVDVVSEPSDTKTYLRLIADPLGAAYDIGVAFPKEKNGMEYYSVILDSPLFDGPLNAALFPDRDNDGSLNLVWTRPEASGFSVDAEASRGHSRRYIGAGATP